jgi:hypothetical protein
MTGEANRAPTRIRVYTRGDTTVATRQQYRSVERRLDGLAVPVEHRSWPRRVALDAGTEPPAAATHRRFASWADSAGADLEPAFNREVHGNEFTGHRTEVLVTPALCLAALDGEELLAVYPHRAAGTVRTVDDGLDEIASWLADDDDSRGDGTGGGDDGGNDDDGRALEAPGPAD